jgi:murein DD-endopeptidase MepM/ murein hydrolase activator NlpD
VKRNKYRLHQSSSNDSSLKRQALRVGLILAGLIFVLPLLVFTFSKAIPSLPGESLFSKLLPTYLAERAVQGLLSKQEPSEVCEKEEPGDAGAQPQEETGPLERVVRVDKGDTLIDLLLRAGIAHTEAHAAISALRGVYNPRELRPGQEVVLTFQAQQGEEACEIFQGLKMQVDVDRNVMVQRLEQEQFTAAEEKWALHKGVSVVEGTIESSLYDAAIQNNLPLPALMQMVRSFSFDLDFQRDIHPGDRFQILFERQVDDNGTILRVGPVLFAGLETRGKTLKVYRYTAIDGEIDYFDEKGRSVRKSLMLTPIDGARISSGFGKRRHPILGYTKMHKGLDFAAPSGTPIMAAGNGVVSFAGRKGGYGNVVEIRHSGGYSTLYAHMKGFAKGVRAGSRVSQGQTIGYVGSTGMSTGPHLHYEVVLNSKHVNPNSINSTPGRALAGRDLERFRLVKSDLERQYALAAGERVAQLQQPVSM